MAEETTVEKHYCYPCASSDNSSLNPMLSALLTNQNGGNQMWSNPFVYLVWMMFANRFWNNGEGTSSGENTNSRAIAALQDTVNTNHNNDLVMQAMSNNQAAIRELAQTFNTDINTIQQACCNINASVQQVAGQVGFSAERVINAVNLGDQNITSKLCECCCNTQKAIMQQGYENQLATERQTNQLGGQISQLQSSNQLGQFQMQSALGNQINDTRNAMVNGFAQVGYATQAQTNEIVQASNANTQRILDQMCSNNTQELRDKLAEMSQEAQTAKILASVNGTSTNSIW